MCVMAREGMLLRLNRTEALTCAVTWIDLEDIVPSEIRTQKDRYCPDSTSTRSLGSLNSWRRR